MFDKDSFRRSAVRLLATAAFFLAGCQGEASPASDARVDGGAALDAGSAGGGFVDQARLVERAVDYLRQRTGGVEAPGVSSTLAHLARERLDPDGYEAANGAVREASWDDVFSKIAGLNDTSDFDVLRLLLLLYGYADHAMVAPDTWRKAREAVLGFKYWYTDPTPEGLIDNMWYWTENHQAVFHTCEYLAGQLFPDQLFTVTGLPGSEHRQRGKQRLLGWFDTVRRFGFKEWHSNVYYGVQLTPLLALAEYAEDEEIRTLASITADLMLFDLALHTFRGSFGATHGRSYKKDKMTALDEGTFALARFLFDTTEYGYPPGVDPKIVLLATGTRYRPPRAVVEVGLHAEPITDRERLSIPIDEQTAVVDDPQAPYGLSFTDAEDLPVFWGASIQTPWQCLPLTIATMNDYGLWETEGFKDLQPLQGLVANDIPLAQSLSQQLAPVVNFAVLSEVNTYTYRTADYMLSTAQDFRAGSRSTQIHSWQATFDANAAVFTTHPGEPPAETSDWERDGEPGQWTGTATLPRSAQHRNLAIHLYSPHYGTGAIPGLEALSGYEPYTHAYFPQKHFDRVDHQLLEQGARPGSWTFGRFRDGYIALYSLRPAEWIEYDPENVATNGMTEPFDLRASGGADNVWIVELGSKTESGSFEQFKSSILASSVTIARSADSPADPFGGSEPLPPYFERVSYTSPSLGEVSFGWQLDFTVDGEARPLGGYSRYDNPFCQADFQSTRYRIESPSGDSGVDLDFETPSREVW